MRSQSPVALLEVIGNQDAGRGLVARRLPRSSAVRDVLNPAAQQALTVRIEQMLVQGQGALRVECAVVVELLRGPRLALPHVRLGVARLLKGLNGHLVAHDVVGVRVPADFVVANNDVRAVLAHETHERSGGTVQGHRSEATEGKGRRGVALGQTRVEETDPAVLNAHNVTGRSHLGTAQARQVTMRAGSIGDLLVQNVAAFAAGHRRHHEAGTAGDIRGCGTCALGGLVVRVCVHGQDAQTGVVLLQRLNSLDGRVSRQVRLQLFDGFAHGGVLWVSAWRCGGWRIRCGMRRRLPVIIRRPRRKHYETTPV